MSDKLRVRYGKHWSSDVAGLIDYRLDGDALHVMLLWSAVRVARTGGDVQ